MDKQTLINTESRIRELFKQKKIRSMFHLSGGNEDALIDIFCDIRPQDWVFSTHRSHYHALLKGMSPDELVERVLNGESMHLYSKELRLFTSSIVGGVLPIAVGIAMANKRLGKDEDVYVFVGDMCATMGVFHECLQYSNGHDLPITFVVEDNGYCINADTREVWGSGAWSGERTEHYRYNRTFPHASSGDWVSFDDV